jgi:tetratricopeptide (TPR) repeat protein
MESIQNGFLSRVRMLDRSLSPTTPNEAIQLLARPQGNISRNWLVIMDNADNIKVDLRAIFPQCDFGAILITTRNPTLGNLSPDGVISLDVMSKEEAIELLLFTALGHSVKYADRDREHAAEIVELLGYLPVAIVQAGCYIKQQQCLPDYVGRLRANPARLLRKPALGQRDALKYEHSAYAAFDTTLSVLSPLSLKILGIIAFVHFADFPCPLFSIAASYDFAYEPHYLLDRPPEYQRSVDLLRDAFYQDGNWNEEILERVLEELQQYSMVTLVPVQSIVTLRLHPLVQSWAKDRLSAEESTIFRAAAVRLLVCGTDSDNEYIWEYVLPHLSYLSPTSEELHCNDRAALASIIRWSGDSHELIKLWEKTYENVRSTLGDRHIQTTRAALWLADAYGLHGDRDKMERMERGIVTLRSSLAGVDSLETSFAMENLARTLYGNSKYAEARRLQKEVLRVRRLVPKGHDRDVVNALCELAITCRAQSRYEEAITLLQEALDGITSLLGSAHSATIAIMGMLSTCYSLKGNRSEADDLKEAMNKLKKQIDAHRHAAVLREIAVMAQVYHSQKKYTEAESQWREVLAERRELLGEQHVDTLHALRSLALVSFDQGRRAEAEVLWTEELEIWREVNGSDHRDTLYAIFWLGRALFSQGRYAEAEVLWQEEFEVERNFHGDRHGETPHAMVWLARAIFQQGRHEEAEELCRKELNTQHKLNGNKNPITSMARFWLGRAVFAQGRYPEAEALWREELEGQREVHADAREGIFSTMFWLARAIFREGRPAEAEKLWREELKGLREAHNNNHEEITYALFWLGRAAFEQGRYTEADALWREYIEARREENADQGTIYAYFWLARALFEQERHTEAEALWREEIKLQNEVQADIREETSDSSFWLAKAIFKQKRYVEAGTIWREDAERRHEALQDAHTDALHWQGQLLYAQERYSDAERLWREDLSSRRKLYGDRDARTLCTLSWLARAMFEQQRYNEAEECWREELTARCETHGDTHEDTVHASFWLAQAIFEQNRHTEAEDLWKKVDRKRHSIGWNGQPEDKRIVTGINELENSYSYRDPCDVSETQNPREISVPVTSGSIISVPHPQRPYTWSQRFQQLRSPGGHDPPKVSIW